MDLNFLGTTVVGSYPQPDWLIDREALSHIIIVPRVRQTGLWRVLDEHLEAAQDDATMLATAQMERARCGVDHRR
jgi:5-methyltetrahydropteroyltriglutamate--homocysteine methyltransferase